MQRAFSWQPSCKWAWGRSASYRISVQSNGNLLIGSAYTKQMGLKAEFEITLGRKHIRLKQLDESEQAEVASWPRKQESSWAEGRGS